MGDPFTPTLFFGLVVMITTCIYTLPLVSCGLIPPDPPEVGIDLSGCGPTTNSFDLPGNITVGYESAWGGADTPCYSNLVGNLSKVTSFTFYLVYSSGRGAAPSNVYGYVFDWTDPSKFFVSQPVPTEQLNIANNTLAPDFAPVTATFASPLSLNSR